MDRVGLISRNPDVAFRHLAGDEGGVLLNLETTAYFKLNQLGSLIWQRLDEPARLEQLVEHVRGRVEDAPDDILSDVQSFVEQMEASHLVFVAEASSSAR